MIKLFKKIEHKLVILVATFFSKFININSRKIVVDNFGGRGFGDNPKYIVLELLKLNQQLDIVWLTDDTTINLPKGIRTVKYNSFASIIELATAKVWIDNIKNSVKPNKKIGQFYLQTWHGGIGLKAVEKQIEDVLSNKYIKASKRDAAMTDLMLSDSIWTKNIFHNYFWYNGKIAQTGFPRNDILVQSPINIAYKVNNYFNIPYDKKIILYAPTFRDNNNVRPYKHDFLKIITKFYEKFGDEYSLLIRLHPNVHVKGLYQFDGTHIFNANNYPDMQELLIASEIVITDYSSCMFDAMIAKDKVFLLASDYNEYIARDRNLLFDVKKLPFSFATSDNQLIENIRSFDVRNYLTKVKKFSEKVGLFEDGNASKRVAKIIQRVIMEDQ